MDEPRISDAKRRLLDRLKRGGEAAVAALAADLGLTDVAVRQHLAALEGLGLVRQRPRPPAGRGRPAVLWSLSGLAQSVFPERHAELTVGLIHAARKAFGAEGLKRMIDVRSREQAEQYRRLVKRGGASLRKRVDALAAQRTAEGYMAEVVRERPGTYLLIENNCPICDAATCCTGLCSAELEVFRRALGADVRVERVEHLLSSDRRCVYRIRGA
jgi:predicted ArsR family transcriptional regulator